MLTSSHFFRQPDDTAAAAAACARCATEDSRLLLENILGRRGVARGHEEATTATWIEKVERGFLNRARGV